jgi:hypothetical protein
MLWTGIKHVRMSLLEQLGWEALEEVALKSLSNCGNQLH